MAIVRGVIRGRHIELSLDLGFAEGQRVDVEVMPAKFPPPPPPPAWLERFDIDPAVRKGKYVVKGTRLLVDDLLAQIEQGRTDEELLQAHPELTPADIAAVREYAKVPAGLRRSLGAWADDDPEGLDQYLEWNRQQRKVGRREISE